MKFLTWTILRPAIRSKLRQPIVRPIIQNDSRGRERERERGKRKRSPSKGGKSCFEKRKKGIVGGGQSVSRKVSRRAHEGLLLFETEKKQVRRITGRNDGGRLPPETLRVTRRCCTRPGKLFQPRFSHPRHRVTPWAISAARFADRSPRARPEAPTFHAVERSSSCSSVTVVARSWLFGLSQGEELRNVAETRERYRIFDTPSHRRFRRNSARMNL